MQANDADTLDLVCGFPVGPAVNAADRSRYRVVRFADLDEMPEPAWQIDGHFRRGSLVVLYGPAGSYKSFLALAWAGGIAAGLPWLGTNAVEKGPTLTIASEGRGGLRRRRDAWMAHHGITACPHDFGVLAHSYDFVGTDDAERIADGVEGDFGPPTLVVVDTLSRNFVGDENMQRDMAGFVRGVDHFRDRWGCTVVVVHHTGKSGGGGDRPSERGSSVLRGAADVMFSLTPLAGGAQVRLTQSKTKDDAPLPDRRLIPTAVPLGVDPLGRERSSLVLVSGERDVSRVPTRPSSPADPIRVGLLAAVDLVEERNIKAVINHFFAGWGDSNTRPKPGEKKVRETLTRMLAEGTQVAGRKGAKNSILCRRVCPA